MWYLISVPPKLTVDVKKHMLKNDHVPLPIVLVKVWRIMHLTHGYLVSNNIAFMKKTCSMATSLTTSSVTWLIIDGSVMHESKNLFTTRCCLPHH